MFYITLSINKLIYVTFMDGKAGYRIEFINCRSIKSSQYNDFRGEVYCLTLL